MKRYIIAYVVAVLSGLSALAQQADVVVLNQTASVMVDDKGGMEWRQTQSYKLMNARGSWGADWGVGVDNNTRLIDFSGVVTDGDGNVLRKLKKGDLKSTQLSAGLADDVTTMYADVTPPVYPCVVTYTFTIRRNDGVLSYPPFQPLTRPKMSLVHADYTLTLPATQSCRWHVVNMDNKVEERIDEKGRKVYTIACDNVEPIADLDFAPDLESILPTVYFAPITFAFDKWKGDMSSWRSFGQWHSSLLEGRQTLPENLKEQLRQATDTCRSMLSKINVAYRLLQQNTRYVSIQLGVGGYQPFSAEEVWRTGFGDCKGLSNLMVAMLKEVGVPAQYVIIGTDQRRLFPDFSNANQFNHAIAMASIDGDTLWLECTNQHIPLGYIHSLIAGHDALAITSQGGELVRLPQYDERDNVVHTYMVTAMHPDGSADVDWTFSAACGMYERFLPLVMADDNERKAKVKGLMKVNQCLIEELRIEERCVDGRHPLLKAQCKAKVDRMASVTGQRLFLQLAPLDMSFPNLPDGNRDIAIEVEMGRSFEMEMDIVLPEGYVVESAPMPMKVDSPFGSSSFEVNAVDGHLRVMHHIVIHNGLFPASSYSEFRAFFRSAALAYAQKVVLKKG
ncbi:MAG: transglutaminase family protein [Prevotella sp.]|nr:transglutaminase family protein [Prevotella sp.]